jgi:hypothetical protein
MQKRLLLPLATLSLFVGLMTACDSTSSTAGPAIKDFQIANTDGTGFNEATQNLTAGSAVGAYGEVTSDAGLATVEVVVKDSAGNIPSPGGDIKNSTSSTDYVFGPGKSVTITITTDPSWHNGTYSVQLIATDKNGNTAQSSTLPLHIVGGSGSSGTPLEATAGSPLSVGGFNTAAPSFIGLNPVHAYKGSETKANVSSIDLVVTGNSTGTATIFESAAQAYANGDDTASYWIGSNSTTIVTVSTAPSTQEAAIAALGSSTSQSATITSGGIYVVKTTDGTYAVLTVSNLKSTGDLATLDISVLE